MNENKTQFAERHKLFAAKHDMLQTAERIRQNIAPDHEQTLRSVLNAHHPADLADVMRFLTEAEDRRVFELLEVSEAAEVLDEVDATTRAGLLRTIAPNRLARILQEMPADEGADIVGVLPPHLQETVLAQANEQTASNIRTLLAYGPSTAGGLMALGFVSVPDTATQAEAIHRFQQKTEAEPLSFVYVVNTKNALLGTVDIHTLLAAESTVPVRTLMRHNCVSVPPDMDQEQVAHIFARYDLTALPVVGTDYALLGVITADDVIDVIQHEAAEDVAHFTGSDAEELEKKTPAQVALLRLPWIMTTLFIELFAGFVIRWFNPTLQRYLLLASFMPIISAISGNTGLQSAAIIIRGLSTGQVQLSHWKHAVIRQLTTTMILGGACAGVLGIIGAVWDRHWAFGLVVFLGMFASVNIAGIVGTVVPLLSKRAGFDPALTAGPFETAFQDVVGISIFLSLAAALLHWLR